MEHYTTVLFVLGIMIILSALAEKIRVSSPILLVCTGIVIGFLPGVPNLEISSELIFLVFLPPLLFDGAFNIHYQKLKEHLNTISSLAIGLVFLTTVAIAVLSKYMIPGMGWPVAFVLGAILSATDAVAAIGISKKLGLTHNTTTILEGESLFNDASALVAYRFAVASVMGAAFIWWKASLAFLVLMVGGVVVGILSVLVLGALARFLRHDHMAIISLNLLMPFITYLVAESCHFSGVIAVVVMALGFSRLSSEKFPEVLKAQLATVWKILIFILNGLIFVFIGLELPIVVESINSSMLLLYVGYAVIITIVAIGIRMLRVFLKRRSLQAGFKNPRFQNSRRAISESIIPSIKECLVIGLSGMKGIVSLAIAIGLPRTLENGQPFPMREEIIFITTVVVLLTILGQGLLLPWLLNKWKKTA